MAEQAIKMHLSEIRMTQKLENWVSWNQEILINIFWHANSCLKSKYRRDFASHSDNEKKTEAHEVIGISRSYFHIYSPSEF